MTKRWAGIILILAATIIPSCSLPNKVNLPVPFLCQAPDGNWVQPWQDACEEAAIIMAISYVKGYSVTRQSGNQEILALVGFQKKHYGGHFDLTAKQVVRLLKDYYHYSRYSLLVTFSVEDIKQALASGEVVIAPMAGRMLGNPFYTRPGPVYHYMVFKGYDEEKRQFITNDSGTRRGKDYRYPYYLAYEAIHDWTGSKETIASGRKAIIIFKK